MQSEPKISIDLEALNISFWPVFSRLRSQMVAMDPQNTQRHHLLKFITWLFGHNYLLNSKVLNLILFILKSERAHSLFSHTKKISCVNRGYYEISLLRHSKKWCICCYKLWQQMSQSLLTTLTEFHQILESNKTNKRCLRLTPNMA